MNKPVRTSRRPAAGLSELLRKGYAFVRLDQADLVAGRGQSNEKRGEAQEAVESRRV